MERKPHFLDAFIEQLKQDGDFETESKLGMPWYNKPGDCIMFLSVNEAVIGDRIDECLTLYRSAVDSRVIGFQLKGIQALMDEFDYDLVGVKASIYNDEIQAVELNMMLLKSYEKSSNTRKRRHAYAEAMTKVPVAPGGEVMTGHLHT